ncbi:MAG: DUF2155 domain-containing protein [Mariprofundaceae bacterium]
MVLAVCLALVSGMAACGKDDGEQIQWQLPLTVPPDPHGAAISDALPEWAQQATGEAYIEALAKDEARSSNMQLSMGGSASAFGINIELLGLARGLRMKSGAYIDDTNVHNPAAFIEVKEGDAVLYRGWLYQEFPEMFGPDLAKVKLLLKSVSLEEAETTDDQQSARSSAG